MTRRPAMRSFLLLTALCASAALAQPFTHGAAQAAQKKSAAKGKKDGKKEEPPKDTRPAVTFAGFRANEDGSSRIWVHLTKMAKVTPEFADGRATFTLHDTRLLNRNNKHPLLTEFFESEVLSAQLRRKGDDVLLRVKLLKGTGAAKHKLQTLKNGVVSLQIDFPAPPKLGPGEKREPPKVRQPKKPDHSEPENPIDAPIEDEPKPKQ